MNDALVIEEWEAQHPRWDELVQLVDREHQAQWVAASFAWHRSTHLLVALRDRQVVGFLRFVTQDIGADDDHDPVILDGTVLTEAKVLAFGVTLAYRRQGIGRALQEAAVQHAKALACYQVRSHSAGSYDANHRLKLRMGFGVQPVVRGHDSGGVYFVLPLAQRPRETADAAPIEGQQ